jgi:cytochrome c peroxidase
MANSIHKVLTGTLLSVALAHDVGCEQYEPDEAGGDDIALDSEGAQATDQPDQLDQLDRIGQLERLDKKDKTAKLEELGKHIFFDEISVPTGMSCASCHDPSAGWTLKDSQVNLHQVAATGADPGTTGSIRPPTVGYASKVGRFRANCGFIGFCGGAFWNGRSEGNGSSLFPDAATDNVGDEVFEQTKGLKNLYKQFLGPLADQALNPFPNPVEQNIAPKKVCQHIAASEYAGVFKAAWGEAIDCSDAPYGTFGFRAFEVNFRRAAVALAAWQDSKEVNSFSAKRDIALAKDKDGQFPLDGLTAQENLGHDLFYATANSPVIINGVKKFANCAACHTDVPRPFAPGDLSPFDDGTEKHQLYSDDSFHNIGTPANPEIPGFPALDRGLEAHTGDPGHLGAHKTPTLRNVDKRPYKSFVKAYTHNGWFKSLESLVHFYNTSFIPGATAKSFGLTQCTSKPMTEKEALKANCWPLPERDSNIPKPFLIGDLGLSLYEEAAIVAYLRTFSDTKTPAAPKQPKKPKQPQKPKK